MHYYYALKNMKTGKLVGVDTNSGGYPYDAPGTDFKIWDSYKVAKEYADQWDTPYRVCAVRVFDVT